MAASTTRGAGLKAMMRRRTAKCRVAFGSTDTNLSDVLSALASDEDLKWLKEESGLAMSTIYRLRNNQPTKTGMPYSPRASTFEAVCRACKVKLTLSQAR